MPQNTSRPAASPASSGGNKLNVGHLAFSTFFSSFLGNTIPYPFDVIRCRQQLNVARKGIWRTGLTMARKHGVRSFFRGYVCSLALYWPGEFFYYGTYRYLSKAMKRKHRSEMFCECVGGTVASLLVLPLGRLWIT